MEKLEQAKLENSFKGSENAQVFDDNNQVFTAKSSGAIKEPCEELTQNSASIYGKFKDAQELVKAYNSLQAEFTKKSQRVSELENQIKPVEKLDKIKAIVTRWTSEYSCLEPFSEQLRENLSAQEGDLEKLAEQNVINMLAEKIVTPESLVKDKDFLLNYVFNNEEVKSAFLTEYLSKLKTVPKVKVTTNLNSSIPLTPAQKIKTIGEAGKIARSIIKKQ